MKFNPIKTRVHYKDQKSALGRTSYKLGLIPTAEDVTVQQQHMKS